MEERAPVRNIHTFELKKKKAHSKKFSQDISKKKDEKLSKQFYLV